MRFRTEPLEQRLLLAATIVEHNDVAYIFADDAPRVDRYDVAAESWLTPIELSEMTGGTTAAWVDDDGIYVAQQSLLYRYDASGGARTAMWNAPYPITAIFSDGGLVLAQSGGYHIASISKSTNATLDTFETHTPYWASSILTGLNRIVGRHTFSPSDVMYVSYGDDGEFVNSGQSPYHGEIGLAYETWVTPDGAGVLDDSGLMFDSATLRLKDSFASGIEDVAFQASGDAIVLSENRLVSYDSELLPTSEIVLPFTPERLVINPANVVTLTLDESESSGYRADITPLASFQPPQAGATVDPVNLAYTPDDIQVANDGTVLLFSKQLESVFRWDPVSQTYVDSIRLLGAPEYFAYSAADNLIYTAYASGLIRRLDLSVDEPRETPFATLYSPPFALASVGPYLFTIDRGVGHTTFDQNGLRADHEHRGYMSQWQWNDANQMLYFGGDGWRAQQINADGETYPNLQPGAIGDAIVEWQLPYLEASPPFLVAPDGSVALFGSGRIVDALTLDPLPMQLPNAFHLGTWAGNKLFTIRHFRGMSQVQRWSESDYLPESFRQLPGEFAEVVAVDSSRIVLVQLDESEIPRFRVLDADLQDIPAPYGVTVRETFDRTSVTERGTEDRLEVTLNSAPTGEVVLQVLNGDPSEVVASTSSMTFTPLNWNIPQFVSVQGVNDDLNDGLQSVEITFAVDLERSDRSFRELNPQKVVVSNADDDSPAVRLAEFDGIVYALNQTESRIDRFDLSAGEWLSAIPIDETPTGATAMNVDASGITVAFGQRVVRYSLNNGELSHVFDATADVQSILVDDDLLFLVYDGGRRLLSVDQNDGHLVDLYAPSAPKLKGASLSAENNRVLGRTEYDIAFVRYDESGKFVDWDDSPYGSDYPRASQTWVFPNGQSVVDNSGTVYSTQYLTWQNRAGAIIVDIAFSENGVPVAYDGDRLVHLNSSMLPVGIFELDADLLDFFADEVSATAFSASTDSPTGLNVQRVLWTQFQAEQPEPSVSPIGLAFTPDRIEVASDGVAMLFSKEHRSIFRWDSTTQAFLESIPLFDAPAFMAYSRSAGVAYVAYENGLVWSIDVTSNELRQTPFVTIPKTPRGLAVAGDYLFLVDGSNSRDEHHTVSSSGVRADWADARYASFDFVWSEENQKLYYLREGVSSRDLHSLEVNSNGESYPNLDPGEIGLDLSSPTQTNDGFRNPVRISPDGEYVLLGSGWMHDARTLVRLNRLSLGLDDATWIDTLLYSIRQTAHFESSVVGWNEARDAIVSEADVVGRALALRALENHSLLVIAQAENGIPLFTVLDSALAVRKRNPGDTNFDGAVSLDDLNNVRNFFGDNGYGDADGDGDVDLQDLNAVRNHFGSSGQVSHAKPTLVRETVGDALETETAHAAKPLFHSERILERELSFALPIRTNLQVSATDVLFDASFDFWHIKPRKIRPH